MKRPYLSLFKAGGINLLVACALAARADFVPLVLTADSYNQDMVVEKGAIHAPTVPPITTATLDTGMSNSGDTFYEKGFDANYPGTGIPVAGATITSVAQPDHSYTFATNYAANDAMLVRLDRHQRHARAGDPRGDVPSSWASRAEGARRCGAWFIMPTGRPNRNAGGPRLVHGRQPTPGPDRQRPRQRGQSGVRQRGQRQPEPLRAGSQPHEYLHQGNDDQPELHYRRSRGHLRP